ncbi:MAG TPA: hypothetical protein ENN99_14400, partial [Chloroflexi bacterium]|nr:hypothetical protein [Chloroflexota bacterium]
MRHKPRQAKTWLLNGLLLAGLFGLLLVYLTIVSSDTPTHVYTPEQYNYLSYNRSRIISQDAPVLNLVIPVDGTGQLVP